MSPPPSPSHPTTGSPAGRSRSRTDGSTDAGMVSAETALALPAVVLVLVLCLGALHLGVDRVRCVDAARVAARELARGGPSDRAVGDAGRAAPDGARVDAGVSGRDAVVTVSIPAPRPLAAMVPATTCRASARLERAGDE